MARHRAGLLAVLCVLLPVAPLPAAGRSTVGPGDGTNTGRYGVVHGSSAVSSAAEPAVSVYCEYAIKEALEVDLVLQVVAVARAMNEDATATEIGCQIRDVAGSVVHVTDRSESGDTVTSTALVTVPRNSPYTICARGEAKFGNGTDAVWPGPTSEDLACVPPPSDTLPHGDEVPSGHHADTNGDGVLEHIVYKLGRPACSSYYPDSGASLLADPGGTPVVVVVGTGGRLPALAFVANTDDDPFDDELNVNLFGLVADVDRDDDADIRCNVLSGAYGGARCRLSGNSGFSVVVEAGPWVVPGAASITIQCLVRSMYGGTLYLPAQTSVGPVAYYRYSSVVVPAPWWQTSEVCTYVSWEYMQAEPAVPGGTGSYDPDPPGPGGECVMAGMATTPETDARGPVDLTRR